MQNAPNVSAIKEKVMLSTLRISIWTGRAFDNHATAKVEDSYATKKVGRFNKDLMPGKPKSFELVHRTATTLRSLFDTYTLNYDQLGVRLMPVGIYMDWMQKLRAEQMKFDAAVEDFLLQYDTIKEESKEKLGPLYNEFDYPNKATLREKFGVRFSVLPFPDAEQFGVDLPDADLQSIKKDMAANMQQAVDFAYSDLSTRLYEATLKLAQRASSDGKFHSSAIDNLRDIIEILPKLNFTNDARLTELATQASRELTVFDADALRNSPTMRSDVAAKASQIAYDMSQYMNLPFDASLLDEDEPTNLSLQLRAA